MTHDASSDWILQPVNKQKAEMPDIRPSEHDFEPAYEGAQRCRWCMFHERAHRPKQVNEPRDPDYVCTKCGTFIWNNPRQCETCGWTVYRKFTEEDRERLNATR